MQILLATSPWLYGEFYDNNIPAFESIPGLAVHRPGVPPCAKRHPGLEQETSSKVYERPYQPSPSVTLEGSTPARQSKSNPSPISVRLVCGRT